MNGEDKWLSADRVDGGSEFNPIKRRSKRRKCVITHACVFLLYQIRFFCRRTLCQGRKAKTQGERKPPWNRIRN